MVPPNLRAPSSELHALMEAVRSVLPLVRALGAELPRVPPIVKGDGTPVTAADFAAQAILVHTLRGMAPGAGFYCEESLEGLREAGRPDVERLFLETVRSRLPGVGEAEAFALLDPPGPEAREWWVIDPIDGTSGFVAGAHCSVCVAHVVDGRARLGVVGSPRLAAHGAPEPVLAGPGCVVGAERGRGAWLLDEATGAHAPLRREPWRAPLRWARSMNRRKHKMRAQPPLESLGIPLESIPIDSQCKYALLATGRADLAVRLPGARGPERAWDHLAGVLAASEAGLCATDIEGRPIDPGHGYALSGNRGVLCAPPELHARVSAALCAALAAEEC
jgi:3'(2'), 5'-bisphosphate nucleotidase